VNTLLRIVSVLLGACGLMCSANGAQDVVTTVIGAGPDGIPGVDANQYLPYATAVDVSGNVYVASSGLNRVFKISTTGTVTVVAGMGVAGYSGDGALAKNAGLNAPRGVAVDHSTPANVYIADFNNCLVRMVNQTTGIITTVAGLVITPTTGPKYVSCGFSGDNAKANAAQLYGPGSVAVDPTTHDVYVADYYEGVVRKIAGGVPTGIITSVAGIGGTNCQGTTPFGDAASAKAAHLCYPDGVTLDNSVSPANLFISESQSRCDIREVVGATGDIYRVAGSYTLGCGFTDNVNALSGQLYNPYQTAVSVSGSTTTVKVADYNNARIRQFTLTYAAHVPTPGTITTIGGKGQGGYCNDLGPVLNACMNPVGLAYDASGNAYIGDYGANRVRKVTKSTSEITTVMGWGLSGGTQPSYSDPVGLKSVNGTPSLYYPLGVYADPKSTKVYVGGYQGQAVYAWDSATNLISSFAGNGGAGFAGDGTLASSVVTSLNYPIGIGKDSKGNIYIADSNNCAIREVSASTAIISTVAGGTSNALKGCGYLNASAVTSQLYTPYGIAFDSKDNAYIADYSNCAIREINAATKAMTTIAGGPTLCGFSGDGGLATAAKIEHPDSIAVDGQDNVYFFDAGNYRVRKIDAKTKIIDTVAGDGVYGNNGDGPAIGVSLTNGYVTSDANGNLFISDTNSEILRWVTPSGELITFAGTLNVAGLAGDGGVATSAEFYYPAQIARDPAGNTYVADEYNHRIRQVSAFAGYGLSTNSLNFETQPAATESNFQPVTVSAVGPTTISNVIVSAGYSEIDDCVGQPLTAGQTCEIDVYFQPSAAGPIPGTLTLSSNALFAANPHVVNLSGVATGLSLAGSMSFGVETLNTTTAHTLTLTNSGAAIALSKIYLTSTTNFHLAGGTCPVTGGSLAHGASCTLSLTYKPLTVGAQKSTLVVVSTDSASPLLALATGTGTEVAVSPSSIAFGAISVGTTKTTNLTITNAGTATFTLAEAIVGSVFSISSVGKTCTTTLAGGKSCVLPVEYKPTAVASSTGTITLSTNGGSSPVIPLSGSATSDVSVSANAIAFGTITHATTKVVDLIVKNIGKIPLLTVTTSIAGTGAADYSVLANTCGAGVAPGATCTLPVQFKPAAVASYAATLTVTTNGGQNPTVALTGAGK
jgi:sugar lactone lactonase YvrE